MLNLVIKDGQSTGIFGPLAVSTITQNLWTVRAQSNLLLDQHQISAFANHQNTRTEEGDNSIWVSGLITVCQGST
ncbi:hypothetical protein [Arcticibacter sp.]|uniref:hypothetical protein n=1 Tax=Arcticibacter sp. TaxID=1872630 RepID=UPI00388D534F